MLRYPQLARAIGVPKLECDGTDSIEPEAEAMERRAVHRIELLQCEIEEADARIAMQRRENADLAAENERRLADFERARPTIIASAIAAAYSDRKLAARMSPAGQREPDPLEARARWLADEEPGLAGIESMREFLDELPRRLTNHH